MSEKKDHLTDIILIPATIDNDIPNSDMCLGADTALNCITTGCDYLRLSAVSMKQTVFVVEVPGGSSGYLALMGGIAGGAFDVFIPERKYMISHLSETAQRLKYRFKRGNRHGIIMLKNQSTFQEVGVDAFSRILTTDSEGLYDAKYSVFGYLVEGGSPSPFDRILATILGIKSVDILLNTDSEGIKVNNKDKDDNKAKDDCTKKDDSRGCIVGVIGLKGQKLCFTEIERCLKDYEEINVKGEKPRWVQYSNICRSME